MSNQEKPKKEKEQEKNKNPGIKILDFSAIIMIICLAFIFSLTILNKTGVLTGWFSIALMLIFLIIMVFFLMRSMKKNKEIKEELANQ